MIRWLGIGVLLLGVTGFTECYRPAGRGTGLPKHIRTLAILPLENPSLRFKVEQRLTAALVNEALRRSRSLMVTTSPEGADAVPRTGARHLGCERRNHHWHPATA